MALSKCGLCGLSRSVMRVNERGARVCASATERQCATRRGEGETP